MPSSCIFDFDHQDRVYYSGQVINGRVQLSTSSEKSVREVYIHFSGEAKVHWTESRSRTRNGKTEHETVHFRAKETYLDSKTQVFPEGTLPPGTHTYTFSIPLPLQCPTSCEEKYGKVSYELSLVLSRSFRFDNVFKHPLTVLKQVNLNYSPELLVPVVSEDIKYFCCWPCSSGPVISTFSIPFGGYAPGQIIKYNLTIDNQSHGYDLNGIELKLVQVYKFTARSPQHKTREHTNSLAETAQPERCLRLSKKVIDGVLGIPPVPPTSLDGGIIQVSYYILMSVKTGSCHNDAEIRIPVVIGTVPLVQSATNPSNVVTLQPTAPFAPDTPLLEDNPPNYDDLKPPSFEEATTKGGQFVDTDVDEHNRIEGFIPKYPMYSNFSAPSAPSLGAETLANASIENAQSLPPPYPQSSTTSKADYGWRA